MNASGLRVVDRRRPVGAVPICSVPGCGKVATDYEMCKECLEFDRTYDYQFWLARKRRMRKWVRRIKDLLWLLVIMALLGSLAYYFWPYIYATLELWFGRGEQ